MGTRCLIMVYEALSERRLQEVVTIYTQGDGYPDGVPLWICEYLSRKRLTNGFNDFFGQINGMEDLAAHVIAFLKVYIFGEVDARCLGARPEYLIPAGGVYVMRAGTRDVGERYEYHIKPIVAWRPFGRVKIAEYQGILFEAYEIEGEGKARVLKKFFEGSPAEYVERFSEREAAEEAIAAT